MVKLQIFILMVLTLLQDIADAAYKYSRGRPQLLSSISKMIADMLFSMVIQALFLVQVHVKLNYVRLSLS